VPFNYRSDTDSVCPNCDFEFLEFVEQPEEQFDDELPWEFLECPKCRCRFDVDENELEPF
jgi:hypothetical protein